MIRPYGPADLPAVVEIGNLAWQEIYRMFRRTYGDELFAVLVPDPAAVKGEQVRGHCERHPDWTLVCEEDGQIVGFVTYGLDTQRAIGQIRNNGVHPDRQGQGIAQRLYSAALERFRAAGMRFASVHTGLDEAHAPARRAYEKAGFDTRHDETVYYQKL